jgi:hypothetical protein
MGLEARNLFPMSTPSVLKFAAWLFLAAGVAGLAVGARQYLSGDPPGHYEVMAIGGGFWFFCSVIAFFLRSRLTH